MCRKIAIGAAVVALGLGVLHVTGLSSYPATAWGKAKQTFKKNVPLEFEIERLQHQVQQLVPDMRKHLSGIAEEMAAIDTLREQITRTRANLDKQKANILAMKSDLEAGARTVSYNGRTYSSERIKDKLARDFASYQATEAEVKQREQLLEIRERSLDAAREKLTVMKSDKQKLEVEVAKLEAELKTIRLAQSRNKFHFDDSSLSQCKATLAEIRNRLKVEKTTAELEGEFANDSIPVEKKEQSAKDLTKEINGYFNESHDNGTVAADRK